MIRADDVRFHTPADVKHDWAETNYFSVYLPEPNVTAWVYTVARPGVGAFVCDIEAINGIGTSPLDAIYFDFQQHLPMPAQLQSYTLLNGLSLRTSNEPRDYHIRYVGHDNTEFDWHLRGLMEPYDISDPSMDPLATGDPEHSGFGLAYANHFDMTVRVTGTTKIRGRSFDTDCVTLMDHSWGPRNEHLMRAMGWINACFGEDYSVNTIWSQDLDADQNDWSRFGFAHGYALIDGKVRGLKEGRLRATRGRNLMPVSYEMRVVDVDDRAHVLIGTPVAQHPWACYSNSYALFSTVRWHAADRAGIGLAQENCPLDQLTGRGFRDRGAAS
ncbi:MAG TPA: hypothetical protein VGH89_15165 [Pseudonocardia sp.]